MKSQQIILEKATGILFSGPMVKAILEGRKSMTRRLNKQWLKVKAGDRLWVRETWQHHPAREDFRAVVYRATHISAVPVKKWRPSIFMPRWAARIYLEATADARLEKLQEISVEDAIKEGCEYWNCGHPDCGGKHYGPRGSFRELWDSLNSKKAPWKDNPVVVVLAFRRKI
jgi:hypothetical protein